MLRISKINPDYLTEIERVKLQSGRQTRTKMFGRIRKITDEERRQYPDTHRDPDPKYNHFIEICWE